MDNDTEKLYDYLIETGVCTEDELSLLTSINGTNLDTLEAALYSRTGYRSLEQIEEAE
jgi:hypothetical protein